MRASRAPGKCTIRVTTAATPSAVGSTAIGRMSGMRGTVGGTKVKRPALLASVEVSSVKLLAA